MQCVCWALWSQNSSTTEEEPFSCENALLKTFTDTKIDSNLGVHRTCLKSRLQLFSDPFSVAIALEGMIFKQELLFLDPLSFH